LSCGWKQLRRMSNEADAAQQGAPLPVPAPAAGDDANAHSGGGSANVAPAAADGQPADDDSKLPPGYDNTTQRLIRVAGPLPDAEQTQVALDENVIADHLERFLRAEDNQAGCRVFHSVLGGIHLYCFPPSDQLQRNHWTVCTMGVSGTRMKVPDEIEDGEMYARCELMSYLPADWHFPAALGMGDGPTAENWCVPAVVMNVRPGSLPAIVGDRIRALMDGFSLVVAGGLLQQNNNRL
jgi:hypothetical protein